MKLYAGLGGKNLSEGARDIIIQVSEYMDAQGYKLRTGINTGAQGAFKAGTKNKEIYSPYYDPKRDEIFVDSSRARTIAELNYPQWYGIKEGYRKILAAEVQILLGVELDNPVQVCLMWDNNDSSAGARFIRRIGTNFGIRAYNLAEIPHMQILDAISGGSL